MSRSQRLRAAELRDLDKEAILKHLDEYRHELSQLRVVQVLNGASGWKLAKIKHVRKGIARCLTIHQEKRKIDAMIQYSGAKKLPLDLRPKMSRKKRRDLPKELREKLTKKQKNARRGLPMRKFALRV
eukprot:Filipodium_phascolosomae@DN275_c0_g1_i1.p1